MTSVEYTDNRGRNLRAHFWGAANENNLSPPNFKLSYTNVNCRVQRKGE